MLSLAGYSLLTIQQLINKHKIILHSLLIKLPKIPPPQPYQPIQELKHQRRIGIALRYRHQEYILMFDVAESRRPKSEYRGANLGIGDDLDAEDIGEPWSAVVSKGAEDEVLAFLVEYQDTGEHFKGLSGCSGLKVTWPRSLALVK